MAAQKTARASPELRKGSTQPALPSVLHHHPGHKLRAGAGSVKTQSQAVAAHQMMGRAQAKAGLPQEAPHTSRSLVALMVQAASRKNREHTPRPAQNQAATVRHGQQVHSRAGKAKARRNLKVTSNRREASNKARRKTSRHPQGQALIRCRQLCATNTSRRSS